MLFTFCFTTLFFAIPSILGASENHPPKYVLLRNSGLNYDFVESGEDFDSDGISHLSHFSVSFDCQAFLF